MSEDSRIKMFIFFFDAERDSLRNYYSPGILKYQ